MRELIHRDPIHGDLRYDALSAALIDTASLQRLGRVQQLGFAHLVYRGGTHTRLSHSMGTAHVAGRLVDLLQRNCESSMRPAGAVAAADFLPLGRRPAPEGVRWDALRHLVTWAALLHDVGHVPFGHTLEDEFDAIYERHDSLSSPRIPALWFEASPGQPSEIRQVFDREDLLPASFALLGLTGDDAWQAVMLVCLSGSQTSEKAGSAFGARLAAAGPSPFVAAVRAALRVCEPFRLYAPYMADLVGNSIGADYLDYVRRDPTHVGLDVLRDDRVASRFHVGRDRVQDELRLALALVDYRGKPRLDVCTGVLELVRQRFRFAEIIYYHKTKVAASVMLARAIALIGVPREVGVPSEPIALDRIEDLVADVIRSGPGPVLARSSPSALLDPAIGDESLLMWLQQKACALVAQAALTGDRCGIARGLRGLSLLQAVLRRALYKVALAVDRPSYARLCGPDATSVDIEAHIGRTLRRFRSQPEARAALEAKMTTAAGFPPESLLLYVPPRKSQAKGIDTFVLDPSGVVTLGEHPAVREEARRLSEAYTGLWRLLLFVHPACAHDARGLSQATDAFVRAVWSESVGYADPPRDATWFDYLSRDLREPVQDSAG